MENFSLEETLKAKVAFKWIAASYNVIISQYQADNGIFIDTGFINTYNASNQIIDFCSINRHF